MNIGDRVSIPGGSEGEIIALGSEQALVYCGVSDGKRTEKRFNLDEITFLRTKPEETDETL